MTAKQAMQMMEEYANDKLLDFAKYYFDTIDSGNVSPADSVIVDNYLKEQDGIK